MKLCSHCRKFSLRDFSHLPDATFALRLRDVEAGTRSSCLFCSFLLEQLQQDLLSFEVHPSKIWIRLRNHPQITGTVRNRDLTTDGSLQLDELELYVADTKFETKTEQRTKGIFLGLAANAGTAAAREGTVAGRFYGNEPGASDNIASILESVSNCLKHDRCCRTASGASRIDATNARLPSRCVEVSNKRICLCDTEGQRGAYTILSHRWNQDTEHCKTTTDNINERLTGRGFGSLPQIFQDAIQLTQLLGIRFIWIDALCIIQDGDGGADLRTHAAQMCHYYQSSFLTISFVSHTPMQGILDSRDTAAFKSLIRMPYINGSSKQDGWYYVYRPSERSSTSFVADVRRSELLRRGWILQEWFLSRRIVFCTSDQLYFECQTGLPTNERRQRLRVKPEDDIAVRVKDNLQTSDRGDDVWYDIVEMYSKTSLTKAFQDHLLALSGIANEVRRKLAAAAKPRTWMGTQYVSGLWLQDLHQGLLWQTRSSNTKQCSCGAPTWSWLSRQGELRWLPRSSKVRTAVQIKALRDSWSQRHEETDLRRWRELESFVKHSHTDVASIDPFSTTSMTAGIILSGQMRQVFVRNLLESTRDPHHWLLPADTVLTLARETDIQLHDHDSDDGWKKDTDWLYAFEWKLVSGLSTLDVIGGWVSFDDTRYEGQLRNCEGLALLALHVSTRRKVGVADATIKTKQTTVGHDVCEVLFLEPQEDNRYRRVGVGRIFDDQIMRDFATSEWMEIELV